ncbi:MBL fold metallo-hydrolase [Pseudomonas sp. GCM10022186]|uniref:MBL fold metallo-hydrolase n=1 Tax=Pseudomonas sp. GCM10022186 TaxID=3252650 RepID=UPI00361620FD
MNPSTTSGEIAVRMYRGILGDCFLLRYAQKGKIRHILIDCGVLQGVAGARERMKLIVEDIHQTSNGILDLVVLTHEHHDHLSGFLYERERFFKGDFRIDELWLAWTEDPNDAQAIALHARFDKAKSALARVAAIRETASALSNDPRIGTVHSLAAFMGLRVDDKEVLPRDGRAVIESLKSKAGPLATRYLEPGDVVRPAAAKSLKAMVLGPPRSEQRLRKDLPSKGAGKEVYLVSLDEALALEDRVRRLADERPQDPDLPFAPPKQRGLADVERDLSPSLANPGSPVGVEERYFNDQEEWRRIEDEWLDSAETLALKMDSDTNNTSLVLAFELPDGQTLLFPGDAQVGNWLSWGDQTYPREAVQGQPAPQTRDDILSRVTLYKVGHHCSHNATLRGLGLEKMTDPRLVAMIPVVAEVARSNEWNMPYPDLLGALQERTRQRILAGDGNPEEEEKAFRNAPIDPVDLAYGPDALWVELRIPF